MNKKVDHASVMLSLQRALVGEITTQIRAIAVECTAGRIQINVYYDGEPSPDIVEDFDVAVVSQVVADFPEAPEHLTVCFEFVRCDRPTMISVKGWPVFAFKEEVFAQKPALREGL